MFFLSFTSSYFDSDSMMGVSWSHVLFYIVCGESWCTNNSQHKSKSTCHLLLTWTFCKPLYYMLIDIFIDSSCNELGLCSLPNFN